MANIRKIREADLKKVMKIANDAFPNPWSESYFKGLLRNYPNDFFVAEKEKTITGYILGHIKSDKLGWIKVIAVKPDCQDKGIGTKLKEAGANFMPGPTTKEAFPSIKIWALK